jgi:hypothetical protein
MVSPVNVHELEREPLMSNFQTAFDAGRKAVKRRRFLMLCAVCAFAGVSGATRAISAHHYIAAVFMLVLFLGILPSVWWRYIRQED